MHKFIAGLSGVVQSGCLYGISLACTKIESNIKIGSKILFHANSMTGKYLTFINVLCRKHEVLDGAFSSGGQLYKMAPNYKFQEKKWRPEGRQNGEEA